MLSFVCGLVARLFREALVDGMPFLRVSNQFTICAMRDSTSSRMTFLTFLLRGCLSYLAILYDVSSSPSCWHHLL
jgi:hypothetical protein